MRRRAFTLTELVVAILILSIMAAAMTLSPSSAKLTAKTEADRITAQLYRLVETANRKHVAFKVLFNGNEQTGSVPVEWQTPSTSQFHQTGYERELKISKGFSVKNLNNMDSTNGFNLVYNIGNNRFDPPGMTLQVKGTDGSIHYVIVFVPGSRIRTSYTPDSE